MTLKTFTNEYEASQFTKRHRNDKKDWVVVEGPEDGEWTAMPIKDAIENDFLYSWIA